MTGSNDLLPEAFPPIINDNDNKNINPGIRLFGRRFFIDQTEIELLAEFLSVLYSKKWINDYEIDTYLPSINIIQSWSKSGGKLFYKPPIKLNLKLFTFLGNSRVDTRHEVHQEHYNQLCQKLINKIISSDEKTEVVEWIERLLRGYKGAGLNRTWCAQSFYPLSDSLISQETIWNESLVKKETIYSWDDIKNNFKKYFNNRRAFFARGGELLYLQLCNVFATDPNEIDEFAKKVDITDDDSRDLMMLHDSIQTGLKKIKSTNTEALDLLVNFIESLDLATHEEANKEADKMSCEWCPKDSWPEGYLFAVELNRLLKAALDPVERLDLCLTGCTMQIMRSLCAQSTRYINNEKVKNSNVLNYAWLFTPYDSQTKQHRLASQINLQAVLSSIQGALRIEPLKENLDRNTTSVESDKLLKEADNKYGHNLFKSLGKRLGIIMPYKGPGARFVMTDALLRYLVLTLIPPGSSCTYEDFLKRLYQHYGIAIEGDALDDAVFWSGLPPNSSINSGRKAWFQEMLRAGGFMTELSDAISIVNNEFGESKLNAKGG